MASSPRTAVRLPGNVHKEKTVMRRILAVSVLLKPDRYCRAAIHGVFGCRVEEMKCGVCGGCFHAVHRCVKLCVAVSWKFFARDCRSMGLRALCNDSPRTPPGPEGSNGNGSVSCAAEHPKFLLSLLQECFILRRDTGLPNT